ARLKARFARQSRVARMLRRCPSDLSSSMPTTNCTRRIWWSRAICGMKTMHLILACKAEHGGLDSCRRGWGPEEDDMRTLLALFAALPLVVGSGPALSQETEADVRARETEQQMTDDERFSLLISVL